MYVDILYTFEQVLNAHLGWDEGWPIHGNTVPIRNIRNQIQPQLQVLLFIFLQIIISQLYIEYTLNSNIQMGPF